MDIGQKLINICQQIINWLPSPFCSPRFRFRHSQSEADLLIQNEDSANDIELSTATPIIKIADQVNQFKDADNKNNVTIIQLNDDTINCILSFLSLSDLENMAKTCRKFYRLNSNETFLRQYARERYGLFFAVNESTAKLQETVKVMDIFYRAWNQLNSEDKFNAKHNLTPSLNKLFTIAFNKFNEFAKNDYKWVSVYLAVMYHYGFGTQPNNDEVKKHLSLLKQMWKDSLPKEFKREEILYILANVVLTQFYASITKDRSDLQFYDEHLSVLRPRIPQY